ncbi:dienelactone hydrolase family protein [Novosphingobium sp. KCTC 2891]|uniref:dienelactone hydrolase family protein n=1 Tax=Novosphingobium sp. KCTC 2891 TaxID=2989730 RepID=UPI0022224B5D|nr:dienelactone hydrolase family protein [Novosphingobium sp. KCTC 2891]MCW1381848.1 dienelactone hydrolase family protein [Novosphingobium sp. KCTC 2891]
MALEKIAYADGGTALTGWLARPEGAPRAAVLIFPTIMNFNPPMERRAKMLADAGYLAMVADFYGTPVADFAHSQQLSAALKAEVDVYRARISAGIAALRARPEAQGLPIAAIGYCQGGQAVLEAARAGEDLVAVASFHGLLNTERKASADVPVRPRILVCHGDADPLAPRDQVLAFWEEMDAAGANWHFHSYSGVKHGFTDPGSDARGVPAIGYDASADRQSWSALVNLLDEVLA